MSDGCKAARNDGVRCPIPLLTCTTTNVPKIICFEFICFWGTNCVRKPPLNTFPVYLSLILAATMLASARNAPGLAAGLWDAVRIAASMPTGTIASAFAAHRFSFSTGGDNKETIDFGVLFCNIRKNTT